MEDKEKEYTENRDTREKTIEDKKKIGCQTLKLHEES
jgi:hypothetical protein